MLLQRLGMQLPDWARPRHPHVRYELGLLQRVPRRTRYAQAAGLSLVVVLLFVAGYVIGTGLLQNPLGQNLTESAINLVYWPTLALQVLAQVGALALTVNAVSEQKRRQTWDNLRATESGAGLSLRARWATVYYRLRFILGIILVVRIGMIAGILYDLTAFQGRYIDLLINNITPEISPVVGALLLAFLMTAGLLLPFTSIGLIAAFGLLISVSIQQRVYSVMVQMIGVILRLFIVGALVYGATIFIRGELTTLGNLESWLLMATFGAVGDWGLSYLHLGFYSEVWATIPYGVFFGITLLAFAMVQSALTEWILAFAVRRAERIG